MSKARRARDRASQHHIRDNISWGVVRGLAAAGFYIFFVLALRVIGGEAPFAHQGVTLAVVVRLYLMAGVAGGAMVGLLRPFLSTWWGAYGAGLAAGIPLTAGGSIALWGWPSRWKPTDFLAVPAAAIIFGLIIGRQIAVLHRAE